MQLMPPLHAELMKSLGPDYMARAPKRSEMYKAMDMFAAHMSEHAKQIDDLKRRLKVQENKSKG